MVDEENRLLLKKNNNCTICSILMESALFHLFNQMQSYLNQILGMLKSCIIYDTLCIKWYEIMQNGIGGEGINSPSSFMF